MLVRLSDGYLPAFRMEQYRVNNHPYHAPQFIGPDKAVRETPTISWFGKQYMGLIAPSSGTYPPFKTSYGR